MPTFKALKQVVTSGSRRFPLFIGFATPEDLSKLAEAPSFRRTTSNKTIADNVLKPPVEDWQRPLDPARVDRISRLFNHAGTLMPNPVLLSENPYFGKRVRISQTRGSGSILAASHDVRVPDPANGKKPLWILDGQHRIYGLAKSRQKANPIPAVLLLDDGAEAYTPEDFADLFAQVTTSAQKLDDLHNEWLTFAFNLGHYSAEGHAHPAEQQHAMRLVAELCARARLADRKPNPFSNAVRFNSFLPDPPEASLGGFGFTAIELKDLVYTYYSSQADSPLDAHVVASEIGRAYLALAKEVTPPLEETAFFGSPDGDYGQPYMQLALLAGVLTYLHVHGPPEDWRTVYQQLKFSETDWNFASWTTTLSGSAGNTSKRLASRVFASTFADEELPNPRSNLADYLRGTGAQLTLIFSRLDDEGRPVRIDTDEVLITRGDDISHAAGIRRHVKVARLTDTQGSKNIGRLQVFDKHDVGSQRLQAMAGRGIVLDDDIGHTAGKGARRQLPVRFLMEHYGGRQSDANLTISW